MKIHRHFTAPGVDPFDVPTKRVHLSSPAGPIEEVEVPVFWSQHAADILGGKYCIRRGVPNKTGFESSFREVIHRLVYTWANRGWELGYFDTEEDRDAFYDEVAYMMVHQMASPNSPQYFNVGLWDVYGLIGPDDGLYAVDYDATENDKSVKTYRTEGAYVHPQISACFINKLEDNLLEKDGIAELITKEITIFKNGSGSGVNLSRLRSKNEPLSGGGTSSGMMSFLEVFDRAAGAIKSGGRTRRAATDRSLNMDHPEILDFIRWKAREEDKALALIRAGYDGSIDGEAYHTVSGQNCNTSVIIPDAFMKAAENGDDWDLKAVTTGEVVNTLPAGMLLDEIAQAAWRCADPGIKFFDTMNAWNTAINDGVIEATNPCSEYLWLENGSCNLGSLRLTAFFNPETKAFDIDGFIHAVRLWTIVLDISVSLGGYPTADIAAAAALYRTIGLGYTDLGGLLMQAGVPYNSDEGRAIAGAITALLTGVAYRTSAEMAADQNLGPFLRYDANKEPMLRVIQNHAALAARSLGRDDKYDLHYDPYLLDWTSYDMAETIGVAALKEWDRAVLEGRVHGFRNAQTTVLAPTGTISFVLDASTTSGEPDFSPVKLKRLAGGGYMRIVNQSIPIALKGLGYSDEDIDFISKWIVGHATFDGAPFQIKTMLKAFGATDEELASAEEAMPTAFTIEDIINDERFPTVAKAFPGEGSLLSRMGLADSVIKQLQQYICGHHTLENCPRVKKEHLPIFDCAVPAIPGGRYIEPAGHVFMLAAIQPWISGAISKTCNLPNTATVEDIKEIYWLAWRHGVKCLAIYRDGSKGVQPLSTSAEQTKVNESESVEMEEVEEEIQEEDVSPVPEFQEISITDIDFLESGLKCNAGSCGIEERVREV